MHILFDSNTTQISNCSNLLPAIFEYLNKHDNSSLCPVNAKHNSDVTVVPCRNRPTTTEPFLVISLHELIFLQIFLRTSRTSVFGHNSDKLAPTSRWVAVRFGLVVASMRQTAWPVRTPVTMAREPAWIGNTAAHLRKIFTSLLQ
jgi:hypothetical protein